MHIVDAACNFPCALFAQICIVKTVSSYDALVVARTSLALYDPTVFQDLATLPAHLVARHNYVTIDCGIPLQVSKISCVLSNTPSSLFAFIPPLPFPLTIFCRPAGSPAPFLPYVCPSSKPSLYQTPAADDRNCGTISVVFLVGVAVKGVSSSDLDSPCEVILEDGTKLTSRRGVVVATNQKQAEQMLGKALQTSPSKKGKARGTCNLYFK